MKGNPAWPGGPSTSKPTWWDDPKGIPPRRFFLLSVAPRPQSPETKRMDKSKSTMTQEIAEAAITFEQLRTGHAPQWVSVVLSADTLVITLHEALSLAEKALAQDPAGAAQVQEFHRQLFHNSS